jgi:hypothetical protein
MSEQANVWRQCSACKKPIAYEAKHYVCSVSTCNGQRTGYVFCSVPCFERHIPGARHRDAAAVESFAPKAGSQSVQAGAQAGAQSATSSSAVDSSTASRVTSASSSGAASPASTTSAPRRVTYVTGGQRQLPKEVLIIASRLKDYITAKSDYNTSAAVVDVLSDHVRILCDRAIDNARADGRKTVLDRDFHFLKNLRT